MRQARLTSRVSGDERDEYDDDEAELRQANTGEHRHLLEICGSLRVYRHSPSRDSARCATLPKSIHRIARRSDDQRSCVPAYPPCFARLIYFYGPRNRDRYSGIGFLTFATRGRSLSLGCAHRDGTASMPRQRTSFWTRIKMFLWRIFAPRSGGASDPFGRCSATNQTRAKRRKSAAAIMEPDDDGAGRSGRGQWRSRITSGRMMESSVC